jgi:hypothetical protein
MALPAFACGSLATGGLMWGRDAAMVDRIYLGNAAAGAAAG